MKKYIALIALSLAAALAGATGYPWSAMQQLTAADLNNAFAARTTFSTGVLPQYRILLGNNAGDIRPLSSFGTAGYALVSGGSGVTPVWSAVPTLSGANTFTGAQTAPNFISTIATGTAPLTVASTTNVANLNASSLGGATFAAPGAIGSGTPATSIAAGTFTAKGSAGSNTIGAGPYYALGITGGSDGGVWQLPSGNLGMDGWAYNGTTWTNVMQVRSTGVAVTGIFNTTGNATIGNDTSVINLVTRGNSSGTNGGSSIISQAGGVSIAAIGNYSALLGGSYDATATLYGAGNIRFTPGGTTAATMNTGGNFGLGVVPSAVGSGFKVVELAGGALMSADGGTSIYELQNLYFNGANFVYKVNAAASLIEQNNGSFIWFTAPSGTAAANATVTQRLSLNATSLTAAFHIASGGTVPTVASNDCGSATQGTVTAGGNDNAFKVTVGTAAVTQCDITFGTAWTAAPKSCVIGNANATAAATTAYVGSISTTQVSIRGVALASAAYYVQCF